MKTFLIEITETLSRMEAFKAESKEQALEIATEMYKSQKIVLDSEDFTGYSIALYKEEAE